MGLKRGTKVSLFSPELGVSRQFDADHANAILVKVSADKNPTWVLKNESKFKFEDGEIKLNTAKRDSKKDKS